MTGGFASAPVTKIQRSSHREKSAKIVVDVLPNRTDYMLVVKLPRYEEHNIHRAGDLSVYV
jgi:hypothetical protein